MKGSALLWTIICVHVLLTDAHQNSTYNDEQESFEGYWEPNPYSFDAFEMNSTKYENEINGTARYIVKFKKGSKLFRRRLHEARRKLSLVEGFSETHSNVRIGDFLVEEEAQVVYSSSEELKSFVSSYPNDVDYVEEGTI